MRITWRNSENTVTSTGIVLATFCVISIFASLVALKEEKPVMLMAANLRGERLLIGGLLMVGALVAAGPVPFFLPAFFAPVLLPGLATFETLASLAGAGASLTVFSTCSTCWCDVLGIRVSEWVSCISQLPQC